MSNNMFPTGVQYSIKEDFESNVLTYSSAIHGSGTSISQYTGVSGLNVCGMMQINLGTTASKGCVRMYQSQFPYIFPTTGNIAEYHYSTYLMVNLVAGQTSWFRWGIGDGTTAGASDAPFLNGIYFEIDEALSPNYRCCCSSGGVTTSVTTSVVVPHFTLTKFMIKINAGASSIEYYINGVLVATITTNIPRTTMLGYQVYGHKNNGTSARSIYIDYIHIKKNFVKSR